MGLPHARCYIRRGGWCRWREILLSSGTGVVDRGAPYGGDKRDDRRSCFFYPHTYCLVE